jgi:hypothetical protein
VNQPLSSPDARTAQRLLGTVDYERRFVGYRLHRRLGAHPVDLYGLVDLLALLMLDQPRVHLVRLADWVATSLGDDALAQAIALIERGPGCEHDRHVALLRLVEARLLQAAEALEPEVV